MSVALVVVLGAVVLVAQAAFAPRRVPPDVPAPVVERLGPAPVKGDAAERYASMVSEGKYNAALAADPGGAYGWGDYFARIEDAEAFALAHCWARGDACRIILRIVPERPVALDGKPLSRTAAQALHTYVAEKRAKAIAMADQGGWGGAWGRRSRAEAMTDALENCRKHEVTKGAGLEIRSTCRIIWAE